MTSLLFSPQIYRSDSFIVTSQMFLLSLHANFFGMRCTARETRGMLWHVLSLDSHLADILLLEPDLTELILGKLHRLIAKNTKSDLVFRLFLVLI